MFIATLFLVAKRQKQPKYPPAEKLDKQNVIYLPKGILFSYKKGCSSDTCYNMINIC